MPVELYVPVCPVELYAPTLPVVDEPPAASTPMENVGEATICVALVTAVAGMVIVMTSSV